MYHFNLYLEKKHMDCLRNISEATDMSMAEHIRKAIDILIPLHEQVLSGAMVLGIEAHTTSGSVWIGKGY